jgi:hypothetical protein
MDGLHSIQCSLDIYIYIYIYIYNSGRSMYIYKSTQVY